jgi:hypothetical protein
MAEMYRQQEGHHMTPELLIMLGRLDGKLDTALNQMRRAEEHHEELDARVDRLERWKSTVLGLAVGVGALSGGVVSKLVNIGVPGL